METLVTIIHVIVCFFMMLVILLQSGKGAGMGAAFGGSSQTVFGGSGAGNFLTKLTTGSAVIFMTTSLTLSIMSSRVSSVVEDTKQETQSATTTTGSRDLKKAEKTEKNDSVPEPQGAESKAEVAGEAEDPNLKGPKKAEKATKSDDKASAATQAEVAKPGAADGGK